MKKLFLLLALVVISSSIVLGYSIDQRPKGDVYVSDALGYIGQQGMMMHKYTHIQVYVPYKFSNISWEQSDCAKNHILIDSAKSNLQEWDQKSSIKLAVKKYVYGIYNIIPKTFTIGAMMPNKKLNTIYSDEKGTYAKFKLNGVGISYLQKYNLPPSYPDIDGAQVKFFGKTRYAKEKICEAKLYLPENMNPPLGKENRNTQFSQEPTNEMFEYMI